jgi:hypothetical protein
MRHLRILTLAAGLAFATSQGVAANGDPSGSGCVGTWLVTITALGQPASTSRHALLTLFADGSLVEASQPVVPGPPDAPENVNFSSSGHGVWMETDTGDCAMTFMFYNADAKGALANTIEIRIVFELGPDGDTITSVGSDFATVTAADGTVLFSGPGNTVEGTRMVVALPPMASPSPSA